ncbi:hypothetical protein M408DRAFT_150547 [Serendipita vermifera MAFF 305830]|uniref:Uncharacterized protein n=1 Tax=Serendipita vermifera MAFF 305830 TaxID=933852 RepID=A0A0C3BP41_SERVB|nr:hypothetical protein M408DRAFT_150547 [Serendipita vermifera MAFF 305830]
MIGLSRKQSNVIHQKCAQKFYYFAYFYLTCQLMKPKCSSRCRAHSRNSGQSLKRPTCA